MTMTARWRTRIDQARDHYQHAIAAMFAGYPQPSAANALGNYQAVRAAYDRHLSDVRHQASTRARRRHRA